MLPMAPGPSAQNQQAFHGHGHRGTMWDEAAMQGVHSDSTFLNPGARQVAFISVALFLWQCILHRTITMAAMVAIC